VQVTVNELDVTAGVVVALVIVKVNVLVAEEAGEKVAPAGRPLTLTVIVPLPEPTTVIGNVTEPTVPKVNEFD
jgi:hypothetical protein